MFHPSHGWKLAYASAGCCAPSSAREHGRHEMAPTHEGGSAFGVRRPLRFLAARLDLDETQVRRLAEILDELKTERAQAAVDDRRTLTAFADALGGETFDASRASSGADLRSKSTDRVARAVVQALERIHALLAPEQRERFAYLIRTGVVAL